MKELSHNERELLNALHQALYGSPEAKQEATGVFRFYSGYTIAPGIPSVESRVPPLTFSKPLASVDVDEMEIRNPVVGRIQMFPAPPNVTSQIPPNFIPPYPVL